MIIHAGFAPKKIGGCSPPFDRFGCSSVSIRVHPWLALGFSSASLSLCVRRLSAVPPCFSVSSVVKTDSPLGNAAANALLFRARLMERWRSGLSRRS